MKAGRELCADSLKSELESNGFLTPQSVPCLLVKDKHICPPGTYVPGSREETTASTMCSVLGGSKSKENCSEQESEIAIV